MDINIVDKSNWEKTVEVSVPYEHLKPDIEKAYREYKKDIKLEGFRKGKVPVSLLKKMFGKKIEAKVAEDKISDILVDIGKEKKLHPISPAKIEEMIFNEEDGLKFTVFLEVVPEIEIENYKGLSLEKEIYQVNEEDVTDALTNLREEQALMTTIDKEAQIGHYIVADFQKLDITNVPIVGEKYENRFIQLEKKESEIENELTDQLLGVKVGDTRMVRLTINDSQNQQQTDNYSVTIKEVKEKELPDLDDEFAKDVGEFEDFDDLKSRLQIELDHKFKNEYENIFTNRIIDELVKINKFELPEPMISNYIDLLVEQFGKNSTEKIDEIQLRENFRSGAIRNIKWMMIKEKISELEGIEVTDSEIDEHIDKLAERNIKDSMQIKKYYRDDDNREKLEDNLSDKKIIQFLIDHADVKEKIINRNELKKESKIIV